jgi:hypothetical protein
VITVGIGRIVLGLVGTVLLFLVPAALRGRIWFGPVGSLQEGRVYLRLVTTNMLSEAQVRRLTPTTRRVRAGAQALFALVLIAAALDANAYAGLRSVALAGLYAALGLFGAYLAVLGLVAMALGRRRAWLRVRIFGRTGTFWYGTPPSPLETGEEYPGGEHPQEAAQLAEGDLRVEGRGSAGMDPSPADTIAEELEPPEDPVAEAGELAIVEYAPRRLLGAFMVAMGIALVGYGLTQGGRDYEAFLLALISVADLAIWTVGLLLLLVALFSHGAPGAVRAALGSAFGAVVGMLFGITPGPVDAFRQMISWID